MDLSLRNAVSSAVGVEDVEDEPEINSENSVSRFHEMDESVEGKNENEELSESLKSVRITEESYRRERRNAKPRMNWVVIGHVDAGKSTLVGHLLFELGQVPKKTMHKFEQDSKKLGKSSFLYAWALDETPEERIRGVTMDVAETKFETSSKSVVLLDAPGHKDFIPNMITGAAQAAAAVLVVDATRGEFETGFEAGGQTREHILLVRSLGVSRLIVAVNKMDNVKWSRERFLDIQSKLTVFLRVVGYRERDTSFVPCSGLSGENLTRLPESHELKTWYGGPTVVEAIDAVPLPERPVSKPLRFCVYDLFRGVTGGFCLAGKMDSGSVKTGDKVIVMPAGEQASVKSITVDDVSVEYSFAGENAVLQVWGIDMKRFTVGNVVCDPGRPIRATSLFEARLVLFNIAVPVTRGFPVILHCQSLCE